LQRFQARAVDVRVDPVGCCGERRDARLSLELGDGPRQGVVVGVGVVCVEEV